VTVRLVADAVFTVDAGDTVLAPGAIEITEGLISWVGDPWQVPPAPETEVRQLGGLLMRRRRVAARPLAERVRLAA